MKLTRTDRDGQKCRSLTLFDQANFQVIAVSKSMPKIFGTSNPVKLLKTWLQNKMKEHEKKVKIKLKAVFSLRKNIDYVNISIFHHSCLIKCLINK